VSGRGLPFLGRALAPGSAPHATRPVRRASLAAADRFLGLAWSRGGIVESDDFAARVPDTWACFYHNWPTITRVLRSLKLLGLEAEAQALHDRLEVLARRFPLPPDTVQYWTEAVQGLSLHG
jgi:hypothetical protein